MKAPKTVSGYLSLLRQIANIQTHNLKGYDELTKDQKMSLGSISADIDNDLVEFEDDVRKDDDDVTHEKYFGENIKRIKKLFKNKK
jgi:hypothetical protein